MPDGVGRMDELMRAAELELLIEVHTLGESLRAIEVLILVEASTKTGYIGTKASVASQTTRTLKNFGSIFMIKGGYKLSGEQNVAKDI